MTWKRIGELVSQTEYRGTPGMSPSKLIQPGLSRENREESDPYPRTVDGLGV
jgi:hypothetical protein